ncbi:MAG: DUF4293 domain-containing protein [Rhodothermales bacterium]
MIQRKQSLYLLLGAVALSVMFTLDGVLNGRAAESLIWFRPGLIASGAATAILAVITIFLYENRPLQQKLVLVTQVLDLIVIVLLVSGMMLAGSLDLVGSGAVGRAAAIGMPFLAYLFFYLARRGIRADIELVRSMDRLR